MQSKSTILLLAGLVTSATIAGVPSAHAAGKAQAKAKVKAQAIDPRGEVLSLSCYGCHGPDGKSISAIPSFYGKSAEYIETALKNFKSGEQYSTVMHRHATGYTDEEIHLMAQYFGASWKKNK